LQSLIKILRT